MIFYQSELTEELKELLCEEDDLFPQDNLPPREQFGEILEELCKEGKIAIWYENNIAIILRRLTSYVGVFDTKVGKNATTKQIIKAYKNFFIWAKENTFYYKLETRTPFEKYGRVMAKATGALLEGTRRNSYMDKEGRMNNEYEYGYILQETGLCL